MKVIFLSLLLLVAFWGCGKQTPAPPPPPQKTVILYLWGAPWCPSCHSELPKVQAQLKQRLGDKYSRVQIKLYVPTGQSAGDKPTMEISKSYQADLHLDGDVLIDPWFWTNYRKNIGTHTMLPAGMITSESGEVLRKFLPGSVTFSPEEISFLVAQYLQ